MKLAFIFVLFLGSSLSFGDTLFPFLCDGGFYSKEVELKELMSFEEKIEKALKDTSALKKNPAHSLQENYILSFPDDEGAILKFAFLEANGSKDLNFFKIQFGVDVEPGTLYLREGATYFTANRMGFKVVPKTGIGKVEFEGKLRETSLQEKVKGARHENLYELDLETLGNINIEQVHEMALLDMVVGNVDRHSRNWMFKTNWDIVAIDHGFTFPKSIVPESFWRWNWREFSQVHWQLSEAHVNLIKNFDFEELGELLSKYYQIEPEAIAFMHQRVKIIQRILKNDPTISVNKLAEQLYQELGLKEINTIR